MVLMLTFKCPSKPTRMENQDTYLTVPSALLLMANFFSLGYELRVSESIS